MALLEKNYTTTQLTSTWYGIDSKKMDVAETLLLVVMKPWVRLVERGGEGVRERRGGGRK